MMTPTLPPGTHHAPQWAWGAEYQLWACRLSHLLGLLAVLALLRALS